MTAAEMAQAVRSRTVTARAIVEHGLARLALVDPGLNAYLQVFEREATAAADTIDRRAERGEALGPMAGVTVAIKDNICTSLGRTTCGSRFLERYESPYAATVVERLEAAGAIVLGKTNLDEFAMGSSCEHSAFGPTRNPWDVTRVPGGSSGGSAAAVAAGVVPVALGSDTGGSIRQPASLCGIVGLKPTYGRVSRWGLVAFASSLDQIGPFARTVQDAATALAVMGGHDPLDATSDLRSSAGVDEGLDEPVLGMTLGVPRQARSDAVHPAVAAALDRAIDVYRGAGARIVEIDLPNAAYGIAAYYIVAPAEASSNLARFDGIRYGRRAAMKPGMSLEDLYAMSRSEGFGPEVQRRIMLGTYVLSSGYYDAYYTTALKARRRIKEDYDRAFASGVHAVLMPSAPGPAFRIGEKTDDPLALYLEDLFTVGANLSGLPGVSLPGGFAQVGGVMLPVGVQLIAPAFDERTMLRIARAHERLTSWHEQLAPIGAGALADASSGAREERP